MPQPSSDPSLSADPTYLLLGGGALLAISLFILLTQPKIRAAFINALRVIAQNIPIILFVCLLTGGLGQVVIDLAIEVVVGGSSGSQNYTSKLVPMMLTQTAVLTLWGCTVGAFAAAMALYTWVQHEKQQPASFYDAINYALNRLGRVIPAHAKAFFLIQAGMIVVVPGILFGLQYAFVDAIATLDSAERAPLTRSRQLTSGLRRTIFLTFCLFLLWWVPFQLVGMYVMQGGQGWMLIAGGVIDHFVLVMLDLMMVQYYLDLFRKPQTASAA